MYEDKSFSESIESIKQLIYRSVSQSVKDTQLMVISDEDVKDENGESLIPLDRLEKILLNGLEQIRDQRAHKHSWDEETGFCMGCGWDGNA